MFFFQLYTHPFNIFYTSNITFHSFIICILQLPKCICRPSCLVCLLKSFHTIDIEIFCRMKDYAGCIMYSSLQQSK